MLHDKQCSGDCILEVDGVPAYFSPANVWTKVSMHPSYISWSQHNS